MDANPADPPRRPRHAADPYAPSPPDVPRLGAARALLGVLLLALASVAVFSPALGGELVYDDRYVVAQNPQIAEWSGLWTSFTSSYWEFLDEATLDRVGYYRPLSGVLLTLAYQVGGTDPAVYHWLSLALHVAACAAAWKLGARLFRSQEIGFASALLFALHPMHVESVAWISALHDPLFAAFGFLALERLLAWREDGAHGMPWAAGACLLGALLSKDAAVALVPVALAIDLGRKRYEPDPERADIGRFRPFLRGYAPFACALAVYLGLRIATYGELTAGLDRRTTDFGVDFERLMTLRVELLGGALSLLAWPAETNLFRPFHPELPDGALRVPLAAIGAWLTLTLVAAWRGMRPLLACLLIVPAALAPLLLRVESVGTFPLSDRFLYVAVIGVTLLVAGVALGRMPRAVGVPIVIAVALAYGRVSFLAAGAWTDERALFEDARDKNPRNPNVYWSLGRVHLEDYRASNDTRSLATAHSLFEQGMDLLEAAQEGDDSIFATRDDFLQMNLGIAYVSLYEELRGEFQSFEVPARLFQDIAVRYPESERGWIGLGVARMQQGRLDEARAHLERALEINPRSPQARNNLGQIALREGDWEEAERQFREAAHYRTGGLQEWMGLANALLGQLRREDAYAAALEAQRANPDAPGPYLLMGEVAAASEDDALATRMLERALEVDPHNAEAHFRLGKLHARAGRMEQAAQSLNRAVAAQPGHFEALYLLGQVILRAESPDAETRALHPLLGAYAHRPDDVRGQALRAELLELAERHVGLAYRLGATDYERRDLESAEQWARMALETSPDNAAIHRLLAFVLIDQERYEEAAPHAVIAAQAQANDYESQNAAGRALLGAARPAEALPYLRRALVLLERQPFEESIKDGIRDALRETIAEVDAAVGEGD